MRKRSIVRNHYLRNPYVTPPRPDLFDPGGSSTFVPIQDLSQEQIETLPRKAFTDLEWDELEDEEQFAVLQRFYDELAKQPRASISASRWDDLPEEVQAAIYENDTEAADRVANLATFLTERYSWLLDRDSRDLSSDIEYFEMWLSERAGTDDIQRVFDRSGTDELIEIREEYEEAGYLEDQVNEILNEALGDQNNWDIEIGDSSGDYYGSSHDFEQPLTDSIYFEQSDVLDVLGDVFFESDLIMALQRMNDGEGSEEVVNHGRDAWDYYDASELWGVINSKEKYATFDRYDIETGLAVIADVDWEKIKEAVAEELVDLDPEGETPEEAKAPEERVVYRFDNDFYIQDLLASELPQEGKKMGMCVGRSDFGYMRAVRRRETKIFSLRRPSGKPLLTFEVDMDEDGDVSRVVQVKGKANRLPGWDAGKTGMGKMKRGEVEMANEFLEHIGFINIDEIGDMRPGMRALKGLKENPPAIEEEIDCPVCGLHDVVPGSKSFCEPVG